VKNKIILFICGVLFFLTACNSATKDINIDLQNDEISAKQLNELANQYIKKYQKNTTYHAYHVGSIFMLLNEKGKGSVNITYANDSDPPNVVEVSFDTKSRKILKYEELGRNDKLDPGKINLDKWNVDSTMAIEITEKLFISEANYRVDKMVVESNNNSLKRPELWEIQLVNFKDNLTYWGTIDPYSGEVLNHGIKKNK
jgi:hypothetical protein